MMVHSYQKYIKVVGDYCYVQLRYLHPEKIISYSYINKDKCDDLIGMENTKPGVRRFTWREKMFIMIKH